jgi:hypothetical protein
MAGGIGKQMPVLIVIIIDIYNTSAKLSNNRWFQWNWSTVKNTTCQIR